MARRKKKTGFKAILDGVSLQNLLLHPATLFVALNVAMGVAAIYSWDRFKDDIVDPASNQLTEDNIRIKTPPPEWAKTDLKATLLSGTGSEESASLLNTGLISDAVKSFQSVGWIEKVVSVEKSRDGLDIELAYRNPVAVVELRGGKSGTVPGWGSEPAKLIPVDRTGHVLPETLAFTGGKMPVVTLFHGDGQQAGVPPHLRHLYSWTPWPDERIKQAASLSETLRHDWHDMGLHRIVTWRSFADADSTSIPYQLWTEKGETSAIVIWGNPPDMETQSEGTWRQKVIALREYVKRKGPFNARQELVIDVRSGQAIELTQSASLQYRANVLQLK
jgi:hypothetical protein